jgi:hypothetical protein
VDFVDFIDENFLSVIGIVYSKQAEDVGEEKSSSVNFISVVAVFPNLLG